MKKQIKNQNKVLTNGEKTDIVKSTKENGRKNRKRGRTTENITNYPIN